MQKLDRIYAQVPPGYYFDSLKTNPFQIFWHTQRFKQVRSLLKNKGGKLLDIGCADGVFTNEIYQVLTKGSKVTAIDVYEPSVKFAQQKFPQIKFKVAPAEKLPFHKNSFDLITCLEMLEHVENPKSVLRQMKQVLKKNGRIVILVPQETLLFRTIWWIWTKLKGKVWNHSHLQHFYLDSLTHMFEKEGFIVHFKKTFLLNMLIVFELGLP